MYVSYILTQLLLQILTKLSSIATIFLLSCLVYSLSALPLHTSSSLYEHELISDEHLEMNDLTCWFLALLLNLSLVLCNQNRTAGNSCIDAADATALRVFPKKNLNEKLRWAIIALVKPGKDDIKIRNDRLIKIIKPYSKIHDITIVFFSEVEFPPSSLAGWINDFKDIGNVRLINTASNGFDGPERYGYKYMCKFFSLDVYEYLKDDYDYYMRCDTDCFIGELGYDIFQWAHDQKVEYGYAMRKIEAHKPTRQTIPEWTVKYMNTCNLEARAPMGRPMKVCFNFYNNFHIGRVEFFRRPDVQHYLLTVNSSGYILSHRWGDSTIQAYVIRLFMNPAAIVQIPNFSYIHGSHGDRVVSTFGDGSATTVPQRLPNWKYTPSQP